MMNSKQLKKAFSDYQHEQDATDTFGKSQIQIPTKLNVLLCKHRPHKSHVLIAEQSGPAPPKQDRSIISKYLPSSSQSSPALATHFSLQLVDAHYLHNF